ncbi:B-cell antigen receptor complex-associated protein alpha chain [Rhinophrynus dorsalis]
MGAGRLWMLIWVGFLQQIYMFLAGLLGTHLKSEIKEKIWQREFVNIYSLLLLDEAQAEKDSVKKEVRERKMCLALKMMPVPTSILVTIGENTTLPCNFDKDSAGEGNVTWFKYQKLGNITKFSDIEDAAQTKSRIDVLNSKDLEIRNVQKTDSAVYICQVTVGKETHKSCGTFLWVKDPAPFAFFDLEEATKNRVITAEGIILLLCAIIPGTFLLYKKRWENLKMLSLKQTEGENLYEGLNLEDCSMYEDISRGLQAIYEDVGTIRATDFQLEKP